MIIYKIEIVQQYFIFNYMSNSFRGITLESFFFLN